MFTRGLHYIKPYVFEFDRTIRLYLDDEENSTSYISANLIHSINPSIIEQDQDGEFVALNFLYNNYDGDEESITIYFDVIDTGGGNQFVLGDDALQCFSYDFESILLDEGEFKIYTKGY